MSISIENGKLIYRHANETLWVEPWGKNSLRVRSCKNPQICEFFDWALLPKQESEFSTSTEEREGKVIRVFMTNGKISAELDILGNLTFRNQKGEILLQEYVRSANMNPDLNQAIHITGRTFQPIIGGDYHLTVRFESDPNEKLSGMGQYQQPILNVKGCTFELAHRNSQASVPFILSSLGYGFLWNNPAVGRATFSKNVTEWESYSAKQMDYWITAGDTPAEIEEQYADATGKVPMMPDYGMGFWQCKLRYRTQEEVLEVAREYKRRNIPIDVIIIDFFHWPIEGSWTFDPEYWPDPQGMIDEIKSMGIEPIVSIWPTVDWKSPNYREMVDKGLLVRVETGAPEVMGYFGHVTFFDATNPASREYVWNKCKENYYSLGIKTFWLDEAEPEYNGYNFENYRYYYGSNLQVGNIYPLEYAKAFYEGLQKEGHEKIVNLIRCAWAGSQRYGALAWSGDIRSSFTAFRNQIAAGMNMAIAGIPWWTTDIGGFEGGDVNSPEFRELLVRWFAYGVFCPVFRLHGDRKPTVPVLSDHGGGYCWSGSPNEIWTYGEENYEIFKSFIEMRERLRPYVKELMTAAHEKGSPIIRPLFYEFPDDEKTWEINDSYCFGPDILVAPITYLGQTGREVYLPKGARWTDAKTGVEYEGGQTVYAEAPLDTIPLFVRDGRKLPIYE